jgi:nucleolar MIF4G domain-containing protein 1
MFNLLASELEEVQTLSSSTDKNSSSNNNNKSQENRAGGLKYAPRTAQRGLDDAIRSVCNKLTPNNIPSLTEAVTDLFVTGKYPRADVLASLAENIVANAIVQDTPVTASVSLAYAGLLRGLQILHGNDVGAPVVEHLCKEVAKQQRNQETESPLKNGAMLLASLFVSHCVDCDLAVTFLHALLTPTSTESDAVAAVHFIQNAGDRLRKDAPVGLSQAVVKANEAASGASTQRKAMLLSSIQAFVQQ